MCSSDLLALVVALRARDVGREERFGLAGAVVRRFFKAPLQFFYPPRDPAPAAPAPVAPAPEPVAPPPLAPVADPPPVQ